MKFVYSVCLAVGLLAGTVTAATGICAPLTRERPMSIRVDRIPATSEPCAVEAGGTRT